MFKNEMRENFELNRIKVLLIEDCYEIIESIMLAFQVCWPKAIIAAIHSGLQAINLVRNDAFDCLIIDLGLPDIDGYEILQNIRQFSSIPVLMLTSNDDDNNIFRCLEKGADEYMVKPFKQLELVTRIHRIVARRESFTETMKLPNLTLNRNTGEICFHGQTHILPSVQADIVYYLIIENGHTITSTTLANRLWGESHNEAINSVDLYVRCIQSKFEKGHGCPKLIQKEGVENYRLLADIGVTR